ncbi:MAG: hypothetical protein A2Y20_05145 [Firmicutes bacterium GWF2_51_9]|nr:MAG: hypothetical protein A2Y20_05145 [Firmicutes bacterium GWF2_51_9]OGS57592.1 MAG: hypothetical protein A2Y19_05220 [Firmicutes bacterium GWE2_51_13]HAM62181.1 very short patch repair endonuclease [Erysipelotrichaceae bacterium]HBZ40867.1 very short patch repair endonuclease [Erysipelotrichaceae bacterium]
MDSVSKEKRHEIMSRIKAKDTSPELKVRRWLFSSGLRYRKFSSDILGKPDLSIKRYKLAIFINGCFWHGHQCLGEKRPKSNVEFWSEKIRKNKERDKRIIESLESDGWLVINIWECELKKGKFDSRMNEILQQINMRKMETSRKKGEVNDQNHLQ